MTIKWIILVAIFTLCGAIGGYFFKQATNDGFQVNKHFIKHLTIGAFFYGVGAILNIVTLMFLPYTIVFPLTSITYVWTLLISYYFLGEIITVKKIIGVTFIIAGSFLLIL